MSKQHVKIDYTNHRGERAVRTILPRAALEAIGRDEYVAWLT